MKTATLLLAVLLTGCQPKTSIKTDIVIPPELKDCMFFDMYDGNQNNVVVRCPKSDTSTSRRYSCGKNCWRDTSTIVTEE